LTKAFATFPYNPNCITSIWLQAWTGMSNFLSAITRPGVAIDNGVYSGFIEGCPQSFRLSKLEW